MAKSWTLRRVLKDRGPVECLVRCVNAQGVTLHQEHVHSVDRLTGYFPNWSSLDVLVGDVYSIAERKATRETLAEPIRIVIDLALTPTQSKRRA